MTSLPESRSALKGTPATFNVILWQTLSLQCDWETRALCKPTSSQPFHLCEKPRLPVNLLYNIPGCGGAAEATTSTEAPSDKL